LTVGGGSIGWRSTAYGAITSVATLAAAVSSLSAHDPGGQWLRVVLILVTLTVAMTVRPLAVAPAFVAIWLAAAGVRSLGGGPELLTIHTLADLAGIGALGVCGFLIRIYLQHLEDSAAEYTDLETGIQSERALRTTLEKEVARSRRFGRQFSLMLVGLDRRRLRFDHRGDNDWRTAFQTTKNLLRSSRANIDRLFRYGERSFALVLPETGPAEVTGLIKRLNRLARAFNPARGEPDGPTPINFGVTFFPQAATTPEDLIRRAEIALRLAEKSPTRVKYDGAEAPGLPAPELLRGAETATVGSEGPAEIAGLEDADDLTKRPVRPLDDALGGLIEDLDATLDLLDDSKSA
jgi:diguanylate cyclase (GGDEF)-like protein